MHLETKNLILRPFTLNDYIDLYEYLSEPGSPCFIDMKINSLKEAKELIKKRMNSKDEFYFAITLRSTNKVIGEIFACNENYLGNTYSPCWMINKAYQRKGYAYEATVAFFDYLFNKLNARRIYVYVQDYNLGSIKLCKKLGMREEGLFKEYVSFINNKDNLPIYENTYQYAILRKEWILKNQ